MSSRRAVALALVLYLCLATAHGLMIEPLYPGDESGHVSYALKLADGELPTIDTPTPTASYPRLEQGFGRVWVASHPPLYYAIVAPTLWAATETDNGDGGVRAARLLTALIGAGTIVSGAYIAGLLIPGRLHAPVVAALAIGLLPSVVHIFPRVYGDALAATLSGASLAAGLTILVQGPSRRRWVVLGALVAAAMLTRLSSALPCAAAVAAASAGSFLADPDRRLRSRARAALPALGVGLSVAVTSGWFYLRNRRLYGDVSGIGRLVDLFSLTPLGTPWDDLTSPGFYLDQHDQLWQRLAGGDFLTALQLNAARAITVVTLVGLLAVALRSVRTRPPRRVAVGWMVLFAVIPGLLYGVAQHHANGGGAHARYLLPGLVSLGALAAAAHTSLPERMRRVVGPAALLATAWINLGALHQVLRGQALRLGQAVDHRPWALELENLRRAGVPAPGLVLTGLALIAAAATILLVVELSRPAGLATPLTPPETTPRRRHPERH